MIGALAGTIFDSVKNPLIVMTSGGVGYAIWIPLPFLATLKTTQPITLFIHTHVREDAIELFGFETRSDLSLFEQLLGVSGIGPKTALGVISQGSQNVRQAIIASDVSFFTAVPRLGKKNAQKIIIDLKSKMSLAGEDGIPEDQNEQTDEVIGVLSSMGFTRKEILTALRSVKEKNQPIETVIKQTLKALGK